MTEKGQIVHKNGHRDPVAIIGTKIVVSLLIGFIIVTLTTVGGVMVLHWRVGEIERRIDNLTVKIEANMDSRWRRSDHDTYAVEVERRLRVLETRPFPFTEAKAEQLTRLVVDMERALERIDECVRRWAVHGSREGERKMRRNINVTALLLALLTTSACSSLPTRRYVQMADTYSATVESVASLVRAGEIEPEEGRRIQAFTKVIRRKLDEFKVAIANGEPRDRLTVILDTVRDLLRQLAMEIEVAKEAS